MAYGEKYNLNLKINFFRIYFAMQALKHTNTHQAQRLIGHKDIRKTVR